MIRTLFILMALGFFCCSQPEGTPTVNENTDEAIPKDNEPTTKRVGSTSLVILGTIQDAGSPQIGCTKACCESLFENPDNSRKVVSLGVIDTKNQKQYLFEATPDFVSQVKMLKNYCPFETSEVPDGIFLTHAHIGHYTGLMYLGKEAMNADSVAVFAMPEMKKFLRSNGPWSQLVTTGNIALKGINNKFNIQLTNEITVIPMQVPHRDEYSETVGYMIVGPSKKALFIPDIDKWNKWDKDIKTLLAEVDYAFLDATFYDGEELNNRDMSEIPHPFIVESMNLFSDLPKAEKAKIHFIHFNHTNPVINATSSQYKRVVENGFNITHINDIFPL